ncbi:hypothetical protein HanRHA438_Chr11g0480881 [Helianthus annuus]|nr:hypothetical protein HanRHA438_Chr11g0480881 [Helianthus annuus]
MHKVLHVGPDSCAVVYKLLKEEDTVARGLEPYDLDDSDAKCKSLIRKGIVIFGRRFLCKVRNLMMMWVLGDPSQQSQSQRQSQE